MGIHQQNIKLKTLGHYGPQRQRFYARIVKCFLFIYFLHHLAPFKRFLHVSIKSEEFELCR